MMYQVSPTSPVHVGLMSRFMSRSEGVIFEQRFWKIWWTKWELSKFI